jgi:cytochrome c
MRRSFMLAGFALCAAQAAPALAETPLAGDPAHGHQIYHQICSLCHSDKPGVVVIGPPLFGAFMRQPGSYPGYHYSDALKAFGVGKNWDVATLQVWEAGARADVPGTKMSFPGLKNPKDRDDIIAYLQTLH